MSFPRMHSRLVFNFHAILLGSIELDKANWLRKAMGSPGLLKRSPIAIGRNIPLDDGRIELAAKQYNCTFHVVNASNDPRFNATVKAHMRKKDAYFIFYSSNSRPSFNAIAKYVQEAREIDQNANIVLIDVVSGKPLEVRQQEVDQLLSRLGVYFSCRIDLVKSSRNELIAPLYYMIDHMQAKNVDIPLDLSVCIKMINKARRYCWDRDRMMHLDRYKEKLHAFSETSRQSDPNKFTLMQQQCREVLQAADAIFASAQSESVKITVYFAGATVLLITAAVSGILLMSVTMLPVLASILVAGCVIAATTGVGVLAFGIYKAKENGIYLSVESSTKAALAFFPK